MITRHGKPAGVLIGFESESRRPGRACAPGAASGSRTSSYELDVQSRFDYLLLDSTGISEPLPVAEPRLGRRTVLTFPLLAPPQKN